MKPFYTAQELHTKRLMLSKYRKKMYLHEQSAKQFLDLIEGLEYDLIDQIHQCEVFFNKYGESEVIKAHFDEVREVLNDKYRIY